MLSVIAPHLGASVAVNLTGLAKISRQEQRASGDSQFSMIALCLWALLFQRNFVAFI